jgi:hypothetical protein
MYRSWDVVVRGYIREGRGYIRGGRGYIREDGVI